MAGTDSLPAIPETDSPDSEDLTTVDQRFNQAKERLKTVLGTSFVAVGEALLEMQRVARTCDKSEAGRQKWLDLTGCKTFEEYVRLEFQLAKRRAYQLMEATRVVRRLEQSEQIVHLQHHGKPLLSSPAQLARAPLSGGGACCDGEHWWKSCHK